MRIQLDTLSGISGDIIGKYERDEMKPSIDTAKKLANALEVSLDYLVGVLNLKCSVKKHCNAFRILRSYPKMNAR